MGRLAENRVPPKFLVGAEKITELASFGDGGKLGVQTPNSSWPFHDVDNTLREVFSDALRNLMRYNESFLCNKLF